MSIVAMIYYQLQDEETKELYLYSFEIPENHVLMTNDISNSFPVPGTFHLRFRTEDESTGNSSIWLDCTDMTTPVPLFKGNILVRALQLPPFSNSALIRPSKKEYRSMETPLTNQCKFKSPSPVKSPPEPLRDRPPSFDFIDIGESVKSCIPKIYKSADPPPVSVLTTAQLRQRKEEFIQGQVDVQIEKTNKVWDEQSKLQQEKLEAEQRFGASLNQWETRNHHKNNIRALLATMHNVLWPSSGWQTTGPGDLVQDSAVKKAYHRALLVIHPDKYQTAPGDIQYISERLFAAVNRSWAEFQSSKH